MSKARLSVLILSQIYPNRQQNLTKITLKIEWDKKKIDIFALVDSS